MPSPQIVAREPSRRIKKSRKHERRAKQPVDTGDLDMESAAPSQQSSKAGPGAGAGRESARRVSERMPKAAGANAHEKSHAAGMMDKGIGKKLAKEAKQRTAGRKSASELDELEPPATRQPHRKSAKKRAKAPAKKRSAAPAEAAPTQKQILSGKGPRKRTLRNEGVDAAQ